MTCASNKRSREVKLNKKDRKVIEAFLVKQGCEGRLIVSTGKRLDGCWMGGRGIAEWRGTKIICNDLGSRSSQTVQRALRNQAPELVED